MDCATVRGCGPVLDRKFRRSCGASRCGTGGSCWASRLHGQHSPRNGVQASVCLGSRGNHRRRRFSLRTAALVGEHKTARDHSLCISLSSYRPIYSHHWWPEVQLQTSPMGSISLNRPVDLLVLLVIVGHLFNDGQSRPPERPGSHSARLRLLCRVDR